MQDNLTAFNILAQEKEKAEKKAARKLALASMGQSGFISGKEKNSIKEQLGSHPVELLTSARKINRNALCNCGSGVKYKKCCGK